MLTASANHKVITKKDNREILGEFFKGKLKSGGHLKKYEKLHQTHQEVMEGIIKFKKIKNKKYYLSF